MSLRASASRLVRFALFPQAVVVAAPICIYRCPMGAYCSTMRVYCSSADATIYYSRGGAPLTRNSLVIRCQLWRCNKGIVCALLVYIT